MYDIFYYNILQYVIVFVRVYYCMYITYAKLNDRNRLYVHCTLHMQNDRNGADQREIGLSDFY